MDGLDSVRPGLDIWPVRERTWLAHAHSRQRREGGNAEIAYFTFPSFEGQGIATAMARALIEIARTADRTIELPAQTLPEPNASNAILRKLGFQFLGPVDVPDEGTVWEWRLSPV